MALRFGPLLWVYRRRTETTQPAMARNLRLSLKAYKDLESGKHEPRASMGKRIETGTKGRLPLIEEDYTTWVNAAEFKAAMGYPNEASE